MGGFFSENPICFPCLLLLPRNTQWTAWIQPARDVASACEENVTARSAGEEQTARPQGPPVWTNVLVMGPSSPTPASAAAIPTGPDTIAQSVTSAVTYGCCFVFLIFFKLFKMFRLRSARNVLQMCSSKAHVGHDWKQKCHNSAT